MDTVRYIFAVLTVIGVPPAMAWWFVVHPFVGFWRRVGVKGTLAAVGGMIVSGMGALWLVRQPLVGADLGTDWTLAGFGAGFMLAAAYLGAKRRRYLTPGILAGVPELEESGRGGRVLTEGPYAVVRHPRYVEVVIGMVGYALFANYAGVYLVVLVCMPVLHAIVLLEERELIDRFGKAYEDYAARVPRYIPQWTWGSSAPTS